MKIHLHSSIEGALQALENGHNDWGVPTSEIRAELFAAKDAGREFYSGSECDHFDESGKCLGHRNGTPSVVYGARPLAENWPTLRPGEEKVVCTECQRECIARPELEKQARAVQPKIVFLCTRCLVENGLKVEPETV